MFMLFRLATLIRGQMSNLSIRTYWGHGPVLWAKERDLRTKMTLNTCLNIEQISLHIHVTNQTTHWKDHFTSPCRQKLTQRRKALPTCNTRFLTIVDYPKKEMPWKTPLLKERHSAFHRTRIIR